MNSVTDADPTRSPDVIGVALGGPEVATGHLVTISLVLVDPPVAHGE